MNILRRALIGLAAAAVLIGPACGGDTVRSPRGFADWAVVVVAGDDHGAHDRTSTDAFDNARRDVAEGLMRRGFSRDNVAQFSVRPWRFADVISQKSDREPIADRLAEIAARTHGGCLAYFTSHGSPEGMVLGEGWLTPTQMDDLVSGACGARPSMIIVSACFSGVFVPALRGPNRFVLTAARPDRSSFGCGESDRYPFFDGCVIEVLPASNDPMDLAARVRSCVTRREALEHAKPPSEPQLFVGDAFRVAAPAFSPGGGQ